EPGHLPTGVAARVADREPGGVFERECATEVPRPMHVAVPTETGQRRIDASSQQSSRFVENAGIEHPPHPCLDCADEDLARRCEPDPSRCDRTVPPPARGEAARE